LDFRHSECHGRLDDLPVLPRLVKNNFAEVDLGDRRRTRRLIQSVARIAAHPEKPFTQIFDWPQLKGFYRLCDQATATVNAIQTPHRNQTRQAMGQHPVVLILHDTTELDFTSHAALTDTGPIGDGRGRGFLQHNSLAVVPDPRRVLGLAYQQIELRQDTPEHETASERRRRERESQLWIRGIEATGRPPAGSCWVDVGDRGADIYDAMRASRGAGHEFLFRVAQDRQIWLDEPGTRTAKLRQYACSLASRGQDRVEVAARGGRASRVARVHLAASPVWVPAPTGTPRRGEQPLVAAWVIRIWEPDPPSGVEALEWILVTSVPTQTIAEIRERRDWYGCRWMVEVFHDIEKNGCSEEDRRFETAARMTACVAILALVAVRIFQLRTALASQPDASAEEVASADEIAVVKAWVEHRGRKRFTVRDFVRGVASLGGFLGRTGDGEPGVRTLWRGYQRLQDLLMGYQIQKANMGNR
jgi:hypothetical protein